MGAGVGCYPLAHPDDPRELLRAPLHHPLVLGGRARDAGRLVRHVEDCDVYGDHVPRREDPEVGDHGPVGAGDAVAGRGDVYGVGEVADVLGAEVADVARGGVPHGDEEPVAPVLVALPAPDVAPEEGALVAEAAYAGLPVPLHVVLLDPDGADGADVVADGGVGALPAGAVLPVEAPASPAHLGVGGEMDVHLTPLGTAAYGDVLDAAAVDAAAVALEVADDDHRVGVGDALSHVGLLEEDAVGDVNSHVLGPVGAVGDDDGTAHRLCREAVGCSRLQVELGGTPGAVVVVGGRRRVGDEGDPPVLLHPVDDHPHQYGPQVGRVGPLAHVALDGDRVPRLEAVGQPGVIEELNRLRRDARC